MISPPLLPLQGGRESKGRRTSGRHRWVWILARIQLLQQGFNWSSVVSGTVEPAEFVNKELLGLKSALATRAGQLDGYGYYL